MMNNLVSKKTQKVTKAIGYVIELILGGTFLVIGATDIEYTEMENLVCAFGIFIMMLATLGPVAFFLNDLRRFYRIVLPAAAVVNAWKFKKLHIITGTTRYCHRIMKDNRCSYEELYHIFQDAFDAKYYLAEEEE